MVTYMLYVKVDKHGGMRGNYGTEQKACDGHEGYTAGGDADSGLLYSCD